MTEEYSVSTRVGEEILKYVKGREDVKYTAMSYEFWMVIVISAPEEIHSMISAIINIYS